MKNPILTVIVTAYNREKFLKRALISAVNQTLDRNLYEIVCIKNFKNKDIDGYIKKNNIVSMTAGNGIIGKYIYIASKKAKGDILVFLDDDDTFSKEKLERIYDVFKNHEVGFYHNSALKSKDLKSVSSMGMKNKNDFRIISFPYRKGFRLLKNAAFNVSSMAIKKNLLLKHGDELRTVVTSPDTFMLTVSLIENVSIFTDNNELTFYRMHNMNSSIHHNVQNAIESTDKYGIPALLYQLKLAVKYKNKTAEKMLSNYIFMFSTSLDILKGDRKHIISTLKYFSAFNKRLVERLALVFLFLIGSRYPYNVLTRNYKK